MTETTDPAAAYEAVEGEMSRVLIGNQTVVRRLTIALLTGGHVLLEGVPGVAKTTIAGLFARATGLDHNRIQLTPDTLPADLTGTSVYREGTGEFEVQTGPVFANVVVADEINRATPKTQSALLEAMQEGQVTIDGESHALPEPYLVVATQNPVEMEGTFELPEAQRDRFQSKLTVSIPDRSEERALLDRFDDTPGLGPADIDRVIDPESLPKLKDAVTAVHVAPAVKQYVLDVVAATREHPSIEHGASPRAALAFQDAIKARAAIHGRDYALPEDVKTLAEPVLSHRLVLGTDATLGDVAPVDLVAEAISSVDPPSAGAVEEAATTQNSSDRGNAATDGGSSADTTE
jgi:MoxR-like ATPase